MLSTFAMELLKTQGMMMTNLGGIFQDMDDLASKDVSETDFIVGVVKSSHFKPLIKSYGKLLKMALTTKMLKENFKFFTSSSYRQEFRKESDKLVSAF